MKRYLLLAATAAALGASQPAAAATNFVVNGGFEKPVDSSGASIVIYAGAEPTGFGWTVTEGSADVHNTNGPFGGEPDPAGAGVGALDLIGMGDKCGIAQSFATQIGALYVLTFDYAKFPFGPSASMDFGVRGANGNLFSQNV